MQRGFGGNMDDEHGKEIVESYSPIALKFFRFFIDDHLGFINFFKGIAHTFLGDLEKGIAGWFRDKSNSYAAAMAASVILPDDSSRMDYALYIFGREKAKASADAGNCWGQYIYAHFLLIGSLFGAETDIEKAIEYLNLSAAQGYPVSQCLLGQCYEDGFGVAKDKEKALQFYHIAALQEYDEAQYSYGLSKYQLENGTDEDKKEGLQFLKKAASQDHELARDLIKKLKGEGRISNQK